MLRSGIRSLRQIAEVAALAVLCLLFFPLGAAASPRTLGQAAKRLGYEELLRSGSERVSEKKWPQAISDLQAALRARPQDATALNELSFAFLMTRKIDQAQRTAEAAVKFARASEVKASGLFQLGRIAEARSRSADAMEHYLASLKLRHRDETVWRLYHLKEFSDALPCRDARSLSAICECLSQLMGGACIGEDKLAPTLMRLRATWAPEPGHSGVSSVFLAVQAAGGWFLAAHLGRLRQDPQHPLIITDMKTEVSELGARRVYQVEYTFFDDNLRCMTLGNREIRGLGRTYDVECIKEDRHAVLCTSSEDGQSVDCPVAGRIGCKRSKAVQVVDEFSHLGPALSAQVRGWEARSKSSARTKLSLAPGGAITGSLLAEDSTVDACPGERPVDVRIY
jgi:tetratricopeptide (TPR) repeat protein